MTIACPSLHKVAGGNEQGLARRRVPFDIAVLRAAHFSPRSSKVSKRATPKADQPATKNRP